jgi:hypothetical protein
LLCDVCSHKSMIGNCKKFGCLTWNKQPSVSHHIHTAAHLQTWYMKFEQYSGSHISHVNYNKHWLKESNKTSPLMQYWVFAIYLTIVSEGKQMTLLLWEENSYSTVQQNILNICRLRTLLYLWTFCMKLLLEMQC